jgi:hypothetical protein
MATNKTPKKPVSERQLAANRANAQKSTGPTSDTGKSVSKYNSLRHGLNSFLVCLPSEDKEMYEEIRAEYHAHPGGKPGCDRDEVAAATTGTVVSQARSIHV